MCVKLVKTRINSEKIHAIIIADYPLSLKDTENAVRTKYFQGISPEETKVLLYSEKEKELATQTAELLKAKSCKDCINCPRSF